MRPRTIWYGGAQTISLGNSYDNIKPNVDIEFVLDDDDEELTAETVSEIQEQWGELFDLCVKQHYAKVKKRRKGGLDDE